MIWLEKAIQYLDESLKYVSHELDKLDWKLDISPKNDKLSQHISAFSNLPGGGFLVYGINNKTREIVGVTTKQVEVILDKFSNLTRDSVEPQVVFEYKVQEYKESKTLLFIYIKENDIKPVHIKSKGIEESFIRNGGTTRKASRQDVGNLILNSKSPVFEELYASKLKNENEVLSSLDYTSICKLLSKPVPSTPLEILYFLNQEKMIKNVSDDGYYITNFGVLACAYRLNDFDNLTRKSIRLIKYEGKTKTGKSKEYPGNKGYAIAFESLIDFVKSLLPGSEIIENALRRETAVYPDIALRELIANALIHQDFTIRGSGPMIEIFDDRIEISNPGNLLPSKQIDRLIRTTPESRNEILAQAFRRYNICEERGSGFEKAVTAIEFFGLPPLKFEENRNSFKVIMYSPKTFAEMSLSERIEACYQHSIIQYFASGGMNNTSLRNRFKMHDKQSSQISRLIKDAIESGKIKPKTPENESKKFTSYVPYWA